MKLCVSIVNTHQSTVPTVRIPIKLTQVRDDSCSERIQVNGADKFEEIWILLAQDGFVAVLKQMSSALMPTVEVDRIACQQPPHDHRNRHGSRPKEQMEMVGNECPGKTACGGFRQNCSEPFDKMIAVTIIKEDPPPLNPTA